MKSRIVVEWSIAPSGTKGGELKSSVGSNPTDSEILYFLGDIMKWQEFALDKLAETKIFEMAFERKVAKGKIQNISPQLIKHITKLFLFDSPNDVNHWKSEINGWLSSLFDIRLKPGNKHPDKNSLYTWLVFDSAPNYDADFVEELVISLDEYEGYSAPVHDYEPEFVINKVLSIVDKICDDIGKGIPHKIDYYLQ